MVLEGLVSWVSTLLTSDNVKLPALKSSNKRAEEKDTCARFAMLQNPVERLLEEGRWLSAIEKEKYYLSQMKTYVPMKTKLHFRVGFFIFHIFLLQGCECVVPSCSQITGFTLIDRVSKNDLIFGSNPLYFKDSMGIKTNQIPYFTPVASMDSASLYLPDADTIYLRLNSFEVDTAIVSYSHTKADYCCHNGHSSPTYLVFKGRRINIQGSKFLIEK